VEPVQAGIYQALMLGAVAIIGAGVAWVVAVLGRLAREQNARGRENQVRDTQRAEIQENVRRLVNGDGAQYDPEKQHPPRSVNDGRREMHPKNVLKSEELDVKNFKNEGQNPSLEITEGSKGEF
jgi:hypothetical protein